MDYYNVEAEAVAVEVFYENTPCYNIDLIIHDVEKKLLIAI